MTVRTTRNFNRIDCAHFEWKHISGCCGRVVKSGACKLTEDKVCLTRADYCKYEKKVGITDEVVESIERIY